MRSEVKTPEIQSGPGSEVKRIYVAPDWRNRHVGSVILDRLLDQESARMFPREVWHSIRRI